MLNAKEIKMINDAIDVKTEALKRAAKTEKNEDIKELRNKEKMEYHNLQMKINTKGLFDEPQISKQK